MKNWIKKHLGIKNLEEKIELLQWQINNPAKFSVGEFYKGLIILDVYYERLLVPSFTYSFERIYMFSDGEVKQFLSEDILVQIISSRK